MNYSEAAFFDRNACQHVVAWLEYRRQEQTRAALDAQRRRERIRMPRA